MHRGLLIALAVCFAVGCAGVVPPAADTTIDWTAMAEERVPEIVTRDPDGSERVTKRWLVGLDGDGLIRTGDTRWFRNIERADSAFREKYGFQDWLIHPFGEPDKNVMRLVPRE